MGRPLVVCLGLLALLPLVMARPARLDCRARWNMTMVQNALATQPQYGGASELAAHVKQPWPQEVRHGQTYRVVRYCYTNEVTRRWIDCKVQEALGRWRDKLDSVGFAGTTNLEFEERHDGNSIQGLRQPHYCAKPAGGWNLDHVPADTLWIQMVPTMGVAADTTVGYQPLDGPASPGRHRMRVGPHVTVDSLTHEFGHVFGMIHEVSRSDRDEYIHYQCEKVDGYHTAIAAAMQDNPGWTRDEAHTELCEDQELADRYDFPGAEFVKVTGHDEPTGFDVESVMLYASTDFMDRVQCFSDPSSCPIAAWARESGRPDRSASTVGIARNTHPSDGDAGFVQRWYPVSSSQTASPVIQT